MSGFGNFAHSLAQPDIHVGFSSNSDSCRLAIICKCLLTVTPLWETDQKPRGQSAFSKISSFSASGAIFSYLIQSQSYKGIIADIELLPVFKMFFRATDQNAGSGLGLYIVKETVEKLKGKVSIESEPNKGTTLKMKLPNMRPGKISVKA